MYLFSGTVTINAIRRETASPHQNRGDVAVTINAFGIRNSMMLSTVSIEAIETVSVAAVILIASLALVVCLRTPRYVNR